MLDKKGKYRRAFNKNQKFHSNTVQNKYNSIIRLNYLHSSFLNKFIYQQKDENPDPEDHIGKSKSKIEFENFFKNIS